MYRQPGNKYFKSKVWVQLPELSGFKSVKSSQDPKQSSFFIGCSVFVDAKLRAETRLLCSFNSYTKEPVSKYFQDV
jgi:hypothetical protein